jgi:hypothetical protein
MTSSIRIMPVLFAAGILLFCAAFFLRPSSSHSSAAGEHRPVIVELFTSEGCSSCPPADALLGHLRQDLAAQQIEVVPLGFRVDYWNSLGWNDRFSSAEFTRRQEDYIKTMKLDGPYTPQMVVNGEAEFVGNDASQAHSSITHAANQPQTAEIKISPARRLARVKTMDARCIMHRWCGRLKRSASYTAAALKRRCRSIWKKTGSGMICGPWYLCRMVPAAGLKALLQLPCRTSCADVRPNLSSSS